MTASNDLQKDTKRKQGSNSNLIDEKGKINLAAVREDAKKAEEKRVQEVKENRKKYFDNERDKEMKNNQLFTGLFDLIEREKEETVTREIEREIEMKNKQIVEATRKKHNLYTLEEESKRDRLRNLVNSAIKGANADD